MPFMQPQVYFGQYFEVETNEGTEIVPYEAAGPTIRAGFYDKPVEDLLDYLDGTPLDPGACCELREGWLARMSAPGYMDCTDWSAHESHDEACAYLKEWYEEDDESEESGGS